MQNKKQNKSITYLLHKTSHKNDAFCTEILALIIIEKFYSLIREIIFFVLSQFCFFNLFLFGNNYCEEFFQGGHWKHF